MKAILVAMHMLKGKLLPQTYPFKQFQLICVIDY